MRQRLWSSPFRVFGAAAGGGRIVWNGIGLGGLLSLIMLGGVITAVTVGAEGTTASTKHHAKAKAGTKAGTKTAAKGSKSARVRSSKARRTAGRAARSAKLRQAFVASTKLRPMAQQLAATRTAAAFNGVSAYARSHQGEASSAAYLAIGHAYLLDNRFAEAATNLRQARAAGDALADYADFLGAKANHDSGNNAAAEELLKGFAERNPDSIFVVQVPEMEAQVLLGMNDFAGARKVLTDNPESANRAGYQLALAEVDQAQGQADEAGRIYKHVLLTWPLSFEATTARTRLTALGLESSLTSTELRSLGDAYYNAGHYVEASEQYHALARKSGGDAAQRNGFAVAAAACDLKLKKLSRAEAEALTPTNDENGARRLYLLMELARDREDLTAQTTYVETLKANFPRSPWLAEALFSSGNMYMLRKDYPRAVTYYSDLAERFPQNTNAAAAHWRAGWWSYRQGLYPQAARI